ncbi:hypothetical protein ASPCAL11149 [Aspergillus calidoustus]|uniref:Uncharacterized protein n=1 Tax=Aspergillus calidoustus TaxID=454130 RepID=A0A0U5CDR0_ASPCI|nr:hypothetical protein ASPCAL11149 [Aspergillus calidoustus]
MSWSRDPITRDGFTSEFGRFLTNQGRIERVDGAPLRRMMFIPKMTREAQKQLRDHRDFIRGQLQHYGVSFDESEFTGNGTTLLKKALEAGKCDAVPVHILALQDQLHREWFETAMPKDITAQPDWVMDAYFVRIGDRQPDRTKTTAVIKQSFPRSSEYRAGLMREAATKAEGLHHETGWGPKTQTLFMGWDSDTVKTAAEGHAAAEKKEVEAEEKNLRAQEKERQKQREKMHKGYVESVKKSGRKAKASSSPVGSFIVDCQKSKESGRIWRTTCLSIFTTQMSQVSSRPVSISGFWRAS